MDTKKENEKCKRIEHDGNHHRHPVIIVSVSISIKRSAFIYYSFKANYHKNTQEIQQALLSFFKAGFHWRRSLSPSRRRSRKSTCDLVKIKNRSRKRSHKLDGIGVGRIRTVPFSSDSAYDFDAYDPVKTELLESQAEAEEPTNHNAAGFILGLPLATPTI